MLGLLVLACLLALGMAFVVLLGYAMLSAFGFTSAGIRAGTHEQQTQNEDICLVLQVHAHHSGIPRRATSRRAAGSHSGKTSAHAYNQTLFHMLQLVLLWVARQLRVLMAKSNTQAVRPAAMVPSTALLRGYACAAREFDR